MIKINFPDHAFRVKKESEKEWIFDEVRKRWVKLTPEEWVRQIFIQHMITDLKYPASLIAVEKEIRLADLKKRFDIVVYQSADPWMLIECKEPNVPLNETVAMQVFSYNIPLKTKYLVITNGNHTLAIDTTTKLSLDFLPGYGK